MSVGTIVEVCRGYAVCSHDGAVCVGQRAYIGQSRAAGEVCALSGSLALIEIYGGGQVRPSDEVHFDFNAEQICATVGAIGKISLCGEPDEDEQPQTLRFRPSVSVNDAVSPGDVIGTVREKSGFIYKVIYDGAESGVVESIADGAVSSESVAAQISCGGGTVAVTVCKRYPASLTATASLLKCTREFSSGISLFGDKYPLCSGGAGVVSDESRFRLFNLFLTAAESCQAQAVVICMPQTVNKRLLALNGVLSREDKSGGKRFNKTAVYASLAGDGAAAHKKAVISALSYAGHLSKMGYSTALLIFDTESAVMPFCSPTGSLSEPDAKARYAAGSTVRRLVEAAHPESAGQGSLTLLMFEAAGHESTFIGRALKTAVKAYVRVEGDELELKADEKSSFSLYTPVSEAENESEGEENE